MKLARPRPKNTTRLCFDGLSLGARFLLGRDQASVKPGVFNRMLYRLKTSATEYDIIYADGDITHGKLASDTPVTVVSALAVHRAIRKITT